MNFPVAAVVFVLANAAYAVEARYHCEGFSVIRNSGSFKKGDPIKMELKSGETKAFTLNNVQLFGHVEQNSNGKVWIQLGKTGKASRASLSEAEYEPRSAMVINLRSVQNSKSGIQSHSFVLSCLPPKI